MKAVLVACGCVGVLLAATGLIRGCLSVRGVTGGVAVWNHERAAVIVNSKTLTFRGSMLQILLTRLKHTAGVPSEPWEVSLQTVITRIANGRAESVRHPFAIQGITVVGESVLGKMTEGGVVRIDLARNDLIPAGVEERDAYWHSRLLAPFTAGEWSADDRFLARSRLGETVMQLVDGAYHVTSSPSDGAWTYRVLGAGMSVVIESIDENPRWSITQIIRIYNDAGR